MTPILILTLAEYAERFPERWARDKEIVSQIFNDLAADEANRDGTARLYFNEEGRVVHVGRVRGSTPRRYTGADRPSIDGLIIAAGPREPLAHLQPASISPAVLSAILLGEPHMTAKLPENMIHVLTPEEMAEINKTRFESPAYSVTDSDKHAWDNGSWTKGRLRMSRRDDGTWHFGFWEDAPPLCGCTPVVDGVLTYWAKNYPGLYHPIPDGYVMVTMGWIEAAGRCVRPFLVPADREAELREKVQPPPVQDRSGPEYGAKG